MEPGVRARAWEHVLVSVTTRNGTRRKEQGTGVGGQGTGNRGDEFERMKSAGGGRAIRQGRRTGIKPSNQS